MQVRLANLLKQKALKTRTETGPAPRTGPETPPETAPGTGPRTALLTKFPPKTPPQRTFTRATVAIISTVPIGASKGNISATIGGYVEYLHGGKAGDVQARQPSGDGVIRYYADTVEGPGIWNGTGSRHLGLEGQVDRDDFESLLHGRHHITGERLVSARGSAGRSELKVGTPTRHDDNNEPLWDATDAAAYYELEPAQFAKIIAGNEIDGSTQIEGTTYFTQDGLEEIQSVIETNNELRYERAAVGDGKDILSTNEVAELTGVSQRHVQNIAKYYEANKADIDIAEPEELGDFKQWIYAERGGRGGQSFEISRQSVLDYLERRQPPAVRVAYDATLSVEKSVSVLALMSEGPVHDQVIEAYEAANKVALDHLNEHASNGRAKGEAIGSEGLAIASFTHSATRALDPSLHTHHVVVNAIVDSNGEGRTPDGRLLYTVQSEAAALATTELRHQLQTRLGIDFYQRDNGVWEIEGIPETLIKEFSQRSTEIDNYIAELQDVTGRPTSKDTRQSIAQESKAPKQMPPSSELRQTWWNRANAVGFTKKDLAAVQNRTQSPTNFTDAYKRDLFRHLNSEQGATSNASIFTVADTLKAVTRYSHNNKLVTLPAAQAKQLADEWLASADVIPVALKSEAVSRRDGRRTGEVQGRQAFTTTRVVQIQQDIATRWDHGLNPERPSGVADHNHVNDAIRDHANNSDHPLTAEQKDLVRIWTQSGQFAQAAIGRPGTGKTTTMKVAVDAWQRSGYKVYGASVKGEAARHLGEEAGIDSRTVAHWVQNNGGVLDSKSVLLVDEASTLSDDDLHQLLKASKNNGATIRFIGDPAQHGSVAAGGMWAAVTNAYQTTTPEVTVQHRLQQDHEKQAIEQLRHGNVAQAFALHKKAGTLVEVGTTSDAAIATIRRSFQMRDAGKIHPIIEKRNDRRIIINDTYQQLRVQRGGVTNLTTYGTHKFGIGDDVIARSNNFDLHPADNRKNFVRNGSSGTVTDIDHKGNVTVDFNGLGQIEIDPEALKDGLLDLRYSLTSYGVQGATFEVSTATKMVGASTNETLVDLSRGKQENMIYVVGDDPAEGAQFAEPNTESLTKRVGNSIKANDDTPVIIADPNISHVAAADGSLRSHLRSHLRHNLTGPVGLRVEQVQQARIARIAPAATTLHQTNTLPARPDTPWLGKLWDNAATQTALYRHVHTPRTTNQTPWGTALGKQPDDPTRRAEWNTAREAIETAALAIANRTLAQRASEPAQADHRPLTNQTPDLNALLEQHRVAQIALTTAAERHTTSTTRLEQQGPAPASRFRRKTRRQHQTLTSSLTSEVSAAQVGLEAAHRHHHNAKRSLDAAVNGKPATNPNREATIAHETLTNPPQWATDQIIRLSANGKLTEPAIKAVGEWATKKAIYTERWGQAPSTGHTKPTTAAQRSELDQVTDAHKAIDVAIDKAATKTKEPRKLERLKEQEIPVR